MDRLWSPWRYRYIARAASDLHAECIFCDKARPGDDTRDHQSYLLHRGRSSYALLNLYPYTTGHLMVVPYQHVGELSLVSADTLAEMMELAQRTERIFKQVYRCDGINLGMNLGRAAGAGVIGHLHMHILPRWFGDANFMTTVGETRVLPEDLDTSYAKLRPLFSSNA